MRYHSTVTSGLQASARLIRKSPYVVQIEVPVDKVVAIVERQVKRYPSITQTHTTRTALRKVNLPVIQLVVMPPNGQTITLFLFSNQVPLDTRETWRLALDLTTPLTWRNYELTQLEKGQISWRLSRQVRERYGVQLTRLITGRGGVRQGMTPGGMRRQAKYQLRPEVAHTQVLKLAAHLGRYPGLGGVRRDVQALARQSTRLWHSTHPQRPYPVWPYQPYLPYRTPRMAPLSDLQDGVSPGGGEGELDPRHPQRPHPERTPAEVAT